MIHLAFNDPAAHHVPRIRVKQLVTRFHETVPVLSASAKCLNEFDCVSFPIFVFNGGGLGCWAFGSARDFLAGPRGAVDKRRVVPENVHFFFFLISRPKWAAACNGNANKDRLP